MVDIDAFRAHLCSSNHVSSARDIHEIALQGTLWDAANQLLRPQIHLLLASHAGEFGPQAAGLQVVMHWQFRSINRGSGSLLKRHVQAIAEKDSSLTVGHLLLLMY